MNKKVRMADIAEKLGISVVSVSNGLAGRDGVSDEMRTRIQETARELGYSSAHFLKPEASGVQNTIGVLTVERSFACNTFYSGLYHALLVRAKALGYSLMLEIVQPQDEDACRMPEIMTGEKVQGLIFMGDIRHEYLQTAIGFGLPYMLLDFYDTALEADCVLGSNLLGSFQLTERILATGRTRIGFLGSIYATSSIMDRYLGYEMALLRHGIRVRRDWVLEDRDENGASIPIQLPTEMPQAFVCNNDFAAYNLVELAKHRGLRVPEDMAITGYDDFLYSTLCSPQITTYRVNVDEMASSVLSTLIRKLRHKPTVPGMVHVRGSVIVRQSV